MSFAADKTDRWHPDVWFPEKGSAEADAASPSPGDQLQASLAAVRSTLPLPLEQIQKPDPAGLSDLTDRIESVENSNLIIPLAHTLTSRELGLVFPLLAAVATAQAPDRAAVRQAATLVDRLLLIVRERACPSLYQIGWQSFQMHFPCLPIARALSVLCRILDIRLQTGAILIRPGSGRPELISRLAPPASRQFVQRLVRSIAELGMSLDQAMKTYGILQQSPFAAELIARSLMTDDHAVLDGSHKLFAQALQQAPQEVQLTMLHHFFGLKNLPDSIRNRYFQQIYRCFGQPDTIHPVWSRLKKKDRQIFQDWVRDATIGSHCRLRPDKARLYLAYNQFIRSVEHWDADTLLIHFPDFIVADSRVRPNLAICYNQSGDGHPFELAKGEFNPDPTDPAIPRRQVSDAVRRSDFSGTIGLPFDPEGLRLTTLFLDMRLGKTKRTRRLQSN